jgi:hypothetical protein
MERPERYQKMWLRWRVMHPVSLTPALAPRRGRTPRPSWEATRPADDSWGDEAAPLSPRARSATSSVVSVGVRRKVPPRGPIRPRNFSTLSKLTIIAEMIPDWWRRRWWRAGALATHSSPVARCRRRGRCCRRSDGWLSSKRAVGWCRVGPARSAGCRRWPDSGRRLTAGRRARARR